VDNGRVIRWCTAFLDLPEPSFDRGVAFWHEVTGTTLSAPRGDDQQFMTLVPTDGATDIVRVQRLPVPVVPDRDIHIDLHVDDVATAVHEAVVAGARVRHSMDTYSVLESPGGAIFCIVAMHADGVRPAPVGEPGGQTLLDQVAIDCPATLFDRESAFWAAVTGWTVHGALRPEFVAIGREPGQPYRFLMHRLGEDDTRERVTMHLDIACEDVGDAVARHITLGATRLGHQPGHWVTMRDPVGRLYCLTPRNPTTGVLRVAPNPSALT
jgi:predicted enzyme related to lactoylglutathione lyase